MYRGPCACVVRASGLDPGVVVAGNTLVVEISVAKPERLWR